MDATNHGGNSLGVSLATASAATVISLMPQLTEWIRLTTAVIGLIAACIALYKAIKK